MPRQLSVTPIYLAFPLELLSDLIFMRRSKDFRKTMKWRYSQQLNRVMQTKLLIKLTLKENTSNLDSSDNIAYPDPLPHLISKPLQMTKTNIVPLHPKSTSKTFEWSQIGPSRTLSLLITLSSLSVYNWIMASLSPPLWARWRTQTKNCAFWLLTWRNWDFKETS